MFRVSVVVSEVLSLLFPSPFRVSVVVDSEVLSLVFPSEARRVGAWRKPRSMLVLPYLQGLPGVSIPVQCHWGISIHTGPVSCSPLHVTPGVSCAVPRMG